MFFCRRGGRILSASRTPVRNFCAAPQRKSGPNEDSSVGQTHSEHGESKDSGQGNEGDGTGSTNEGGIDLFGLLLFAPAAATFGLGVWQLKRRKWKLGLIEARESSVSKDAITINRTYSSDEWTELAFRRVIAEGHYDAEKSTLVAPRFPMNVAGQPGGSARDGAHVITPFIIAGSGDGKGEPDVIIVNRGWVPRTYLERIGGASQVPVPAGTVKIRGVARAEVDPGRFGPRSTGAASSSSSAGIDAGRGSWTFVDAMAMAESAGLPPTHMVVDLAEDARNRAEGESLPIAGQTPITLRNTHLEYALTWFTLSGAVTLAAITRLRGGGGGGAASNARRGLEKFHEM